MYPTEFPEENDHGYETCLTLTDEQNRTLECYVEHTLNVEGQEYVLLLPVDSPIEIFAYDDDDEAFLVEDDDILEEIFSNAEAVLQEHDLVLKNTAYALTVAGELPPEDENKICTLEMDDGEEDQLLEIATFSHNDQQYAIYTPLDPLLFFARINKKGEPELLSPEEFNKFKPLLEEFLFDEVEE
ncbi:DUF3727 domain-containing protein [Anabaena sp. FACHB-1237]|uniref:DUF3727 domain-containing protein n=1 Tax=Anabaena sp. FACHB-1237 TaxID=2692769 RepID=UPI001680A5BD|nr:DUF3727 domain-containing protein [Anabaena sp. FACHB-1237]MBD2136591.1 DUF3727 domain-containing protein [Anabaena sp. FACHB-1237]